MKVEERDGGGKSLLVMVNERRMNKNTAAISIQCSQIHPMALGAIQPKLFLFTGYVRSVN